MKGHVFAEVPLLSETQTASMFDKVWLVKCDAKNRISRLINDRGMSLPTVSAIMSAQDDDKIRAKIADEVIVNDGDFTKLRKRVEILYNNLT
jgi:dephospho-CoA kinase